VISGASSRTRTSHYDDRNNILWIRTSATQVKSYSLDGVSLGGNISLGLSSNYGMDYHNGIFCTGSNGITDVDIWNDNGTKLDDTSGGGVDDDQGCAFVDVGDTQYIYAMQGSPVSRYTYTCIGCGATSKGVVPMNSGTPFYTINQNPIYAANQSCLQDMQAGDNCNHTWEVNASGPSGTWIFYAIYSADPYSAYIAENETIRKEVTIVDQTNPVIDTILNISFTNESATITWHTDDPSNSTVLYGTSPSTLTSMGIDTSIVNNHSVILSKLESYTIYYYNVSSCNLDGLCSESSIYSFRTNPQPIVIKEFSCNNGTDWMDCSNISYGDNLTAVSVNCSSRDGDIINATFQLENMPDSVIFFEGNATKIDGYWVSNSTVLIGDSGMWNLSVSCHDNVSQQTSNASLWTVAWGSLESYFINQTNSTIIRYESFNFSTGIRCVEGECGNVTATLELFSIKFINYTTLDSTEEGGDPFVWEEIISNGAGIELWGIGDTEDDGYLNVPLNFTFPFYGEDYTTLYVSSNGRIHFTTLGADFTDIGLPSNSYKVVAPVNEDMFVRSETEVYYKIYESPKRVVIEYKDLDHYYFEGDYLTYEVILYEDGRIKFQYNATNDPYNEWDPIGINHNSTNSYYLLIEDDAPDVHKGEAVTFYPPDYLADIDGIPMFNGTPFSTSIQNPVNASNQSCLMDMKAAETCNQTWEVNATGDGGVYLLYTFYDAEAYSTYIQRNETDTVNITIIDTTAPVITDVQNISITQNSSTIIWITDDRSNSTIRYGTSALNLNVTISNSTSVINHNIDVVNLLSTTTYLYNITSCNNDSLCSTTGPFSFSTISLPIRLSDIGCNNGSDWINCSTIDFGDTITDVRVNCTSQEGYIVNATFQLANVDNNSIYFTNTTTSNISGYWVLDNPNITIQDNVTLNLSAVCNDNFSQTRFDFIRWTISFPDLSVTLDEKDELPVNETTNASIYLNSTGLKNSTNMTVKFFALYEYNLIYLFYNQTQQIQFNSTEYNLTASKLSSGYTRVNISYNESFEEYTLFDEQIVELNNGVFLDVEEITSNYAAVYLALGEVTMKNISDLAAGQSRTDFLNWTPTKVSYHRLKAFVNGTSDGDWTNNYASDASDVKLNAPDVYVELDIASFVNGTTTASIYSYNSGLQEATNMTATLYTLYEYYLNNSVHNQTLQIFFNNTNYNLTSYNISDEYARINISYNGISEEFVVFEEQIVELEDGTFLEVGYLGSIYMAIFLAQADITTTNLSDLAIGQARTDFVNWTPTISGSHRLKVFVNDSDEGDLTDNYAPASTNVSLIAPPPPPPPSGSGGGGGGGSGGGGGGGVVTASDLSKKETIFSNPIPDKEHVMHVSSTILAIIKVGFVNTGPVSKVVLTVQLVNSSVIQDPLDISYQDINITLQGMKQRDFRNAWVEFQVNNSWLIEHNVTAADIRLKRYQNGGWQVLSTDLMNDTETFSYFSADTPGFSAFAVGLVSKQQETVVISPTNMTVASDIEEDLNKTDLQPPIPEVDSPPLSSRVIWVLALLIIGGLTGGVFSSYKLREMKRDKPAVKRSAQVKASAQQFLPPALILYVQKCRDQGFSAMEIRKQLLKVGWDQKNVEESLMIAFDDHKIKNVGYTLPKR